MPDRDNFYAVLNSDRALDRLSAVEHERWAHWQQYLHSQCEPQSDGSLLIPAELVARWEAQIRTPYEQLTPEEQASDREQVHLYLPTVIDVLSD